MPRFFSPNIAAGVIPKDVITRPLTSLTLSGDRSWYVSPHYHFANLIADEHGANPIRVASSQMRCYDFTSYHCTYLKIVIVITFLKSFDHC